MPRTDVQSATRVRWLEGERDLLDLHERDPRRYPALLESAAAGPHGRWDILPAFPEQALSLHADGTLDGPEAAGDGFVAALDRWWAGQRLAPDPARELPFRGGWFLYLGYELAGEIEPRLRLPPAGDGLPTAVALRCRAAVLRDRLHRRLALVSEADAEAERRLDAMRRDLAGPVGSGRPLGVGAVREAPGADYRAAVARVLDYIRDGDVFQVNLSRAWDAELAGAADDGALYRRLRRANPGPFSGLARLPGGAVLSSSPERLVRVHGEWIETRPIAGTRPRAGDADADRRLSGELMGHPKERAEHVMLIDLERNDLGRVCVPGSVEVNELMALESYAHVHHIVSNVRGRLRPDATPGAAIRAVFPGGTITGCPKVRCMEIIAELEGEGRGPYTGAMGYLNRDGDLDLNILIRTLSRRDGRLRLRAGAGIVADSDPGRELEETRAKARGLLLALDHGGDAPQ